MKKELIICFILLLSILTSCSEEQHISDTVNKLEMMYDGVKYTVPEENISASESCDLVVIKANFRTNDEKFVKIEFELLNSGQLRIMKVIEVNEKLKDLKNFNTDNYYPLNDSEISNYNYEWNSISFNYKLKIYNEHNTNEFKTIYGKVELKSLSYYGCSSSILPTIFHKEFPFITTHFDVTLLGDKRTYAFHTNTGYKISFVLDKKFWESSDTYFDLSKNQNFNDFKISKYIGPVKASNDLSNFYRDTNPDHWDVFDTRGTIKINIRDRDIGVNYVSGKLNLYAINNNNEILQFDNANIVFFEIR